MTPVDQTIINDATGNCFAACVASILELSIDEVPNFMETRNEVEGGWYIAAWQWLQNRGYTLRHTQLGANQYPEGYWIASGVSPRFPDRHHAVVYLGAVMTHDPHPSRVGLAGPPVYAYKIEEMHEIY